MHCVSMNLNCKVLTDKPAQLKGADHKGVSTPDAHWMRIWLMRIGMCIGTRPHLFSNFAGMATSYVLIALQRD